MTATKVPRIERSRRNIQSRPYSTAIQAIFPKCGFAVLACVDELDVQERMWLIAYLSREKAIGGGRRHGHHEKVFSER